jgi:hypothetical protein
MNYHSPWPAVLDGLAGFSIALLIVLVPLLVVYTATPYELTIVVAGATGGTSCYASMDFEEVSR